MSSADRRSCGSPRSRRRSRSRPRSRCASAPPGSTRSTSSRAKARDVLGRSATPPLHGRLGRLRRGDAGRRRRHPLPGRRRGLRHALVPARSGAYAEYVTAPSRHFEHKPHALSVEEAGALPLAGLTAWQIVVDTIHVQERRRRADPRRRGRGRPPRRAGRRRARGQRDRDGAARAGRLPRRPRRDAVRSTTATTTSTSPRRRTRLGDRLHRALRASARCAVLRPGGTLVSVPSGVEAGAGRGGQGASTSGSTGILVEPDPVGLAGLCDLIERGKLRDRGRRGLRPRARPPTPTATPKTSHGAGKIVLRVP